MLTGFTPKQAPRLTRKHVRVEVCSSRQKWIPTLHFNNNHCIINGGEGYRVLCVDNTDDVGVIDGDNKYGSYVNYQHTPR